MNESLHDLKRWERGDKTAPEPKVEREPRGRLHCNCGDSFGPGEFSRWQMHVRQCPTIRQED